MMRQLMTAVVCVLLVAGAASAATTSISETLGKGSMEQGVYFGVQRSGSWSYQHDLTDEYNAMAAEILASLSPGEFVTNISLDSATLVIPSSGANPDSITIKGDGLVIGNLTSSYSYQSVSTSFTSPTQLDLASLADTILDVDVVYNQIGDTPILWSSTLTLNYSYDIEVEQQEPPTTIPAPGAVFLGSLGAGLVGWLRRKKSL